MLARHAAPYPTVGRMQSSLITLDILNETSLLDVLSKTIKDQTANTTNRRHSSKKQSLIFYHQSIILTTNRHLYGQEKLQRNMRVFRQILGSQQRNHDDDHVVDDDAVVASGISSAESSEPVSSSSQDYHSFPVGGSGGPQDIASSQKDYRGFNTSIADMYRYKDQERVDCCAIACCGCFQADRDRYLMTGKKPPTCCRRFFVHVIFPLFIFGLAIFAAVNVPDPYFNQMLCYGFVFTFIFYLISQCLKGAWKRRQVRRNLLYAKYHMRSSGRIRHRGDEESEDEDEEDYNDNDDHYLLGQTRGDIRCAHALCGCYATDRPRDFVFDADEEITFCTRIFDCFTNVCCRKMCGMHLVFCGFCAAAQEGRQLEAMVRPEMLRIDYITMQPMMEYYPAIYEARHSDERPKNFWFNRLSSFSRWTVINTVSCLVLLFLWSLLSRGLNHSFGPMNYLVFCLTLLQAFILLALVYRKHTKDVSIDALIKMFAAGFCLSTTLGVFYELVLGIIVRMTMALLMAISGVDVATDNGYTMTEPGFSSVWTSGAEVNYGGVEYRSYLQAYGNDHPIIFTLYLMVTSFILAAMVEEICKYFGFRMVRFVDTLVLLMLLF